MGLEVSVVQMSGFLPSVVGAHGLPDDWHPYGPEPGHDKDGIRTPAAITVAAGAVTISATQDGTTGAALPESEPAALSLAPGDPATGQPEDYPERAPRRLG
jgi:hypothetical protein